MDLIVHAPDIVGPVHIDLTVLSATARKSLAKGVASREGTATASAAERKRAKYPMCAILPFVLEDHGRLGDDARAEGKTRAYPGTHRVLPGHRGHATESCRRFDHCRDRVWRNGQEAINIALVEA